MTAPSEEGEVENTRESLYENDSSPLSCDSSWTEPLEDMGKTREAERVAALESGVCTTSDPGSMASKKDHDTGSSVPGE